MNPGVPSNHASAPARRGFLQSACRHCLGLGALIAGSAGAQDPIAALPPRFTRPAIDSDEGGLWGLMDRQEARVRRSPLVIRDGNLSAYLAGLVCKLTAGHCPDIRVHAVRVPHFNATMAPNGMMLVWSGLLLRVENEAQLVAVLGHELGHYLERHSLEQLRAAKDRAMLSQLIGLIGGVGSVIGQVGVIASMFAFSREHEARADRIGMRLMQQAGYDGREAAAVWGNLLAEMKVRGGAEAGKSQDMLATHPTTAGRRDELLALAGDKGGETGVASLRSVIASQRLGWLQDEIKRGQYEESLVLFDRLLQRDAGDAEALFARGEVFRVRDEADDATRALVDLRAATAASEPPAEAFRSLGLVHKQRNEPAAALRAFQRYLAVAPQAGDAGLVRSYLTELQP